MSEIINNREQQSNNMERMNILKEIFKGLHKGRNVEEVKAHFNALIGTVTLDEICQLQHDFLENEGITIAEVHRLYAAHTDIFKGSIEEGTSKPERPEDQPGHPVHTFKLENQEIENHG